MRRVAAFTYGFGTYVLFLITFIYALCFIGDLWVPKTIDRPVQDPVSPVWAILVNSD